MTNIYQQQARLKKQGRWIFFAWLLNGYLMFYAIGGASSAFILWLTLIGSIFTTILLRWFPAKIGLIIANVLCIAVYALVLSSLEFKPFPWNYVIYYFGSGLVFATCGFVITQTFWPPNQDLSPKDYPSKFITDLFIISFFSISYFFLAYFGQMILIMLLQPQWLLIPVAISTFILLALLFKWFVASQEHANRELTTSADSETTRYRTPTMVKINPVPQNQATQQKQANRELTISAGSETARYLTPTRAIINPTFITLVIFSLCFVSTFAVLNMSTPDVGSHCIMIGLIFGLIPSFFLRDLGLSVRLIVTTIVCFSTMFLLLQLLNIDPKIKINYRGVFVASILLALLCDIVACRLWSSHHPRSRRKTVGTWLVDMVFVLSISVLVLLILNSLHYLMFHAFKEKPPLAHAFIMILVILALILSPVYLIHYNKKKPEHIKKSADE